MEDYSDNWQDGSRSTRRESGRSPPHRASKRQAHRERNMAQSRRTSDAIRSSLTEGGPHRSFVARRFLEDEGDDLEPERMDLVDEENNHSDMASLGQSTADRSTGYFEKATKYNVDQSVNLMDTSAGVYESKNKNKNKKHARPRLNKKGQASMVDIFLDYATDGPGSRDASTTGSSRSDNRCRELVTSTRFLVFVVGLIVLVLIVVFSVTGSGGGGDKKPEAPPLSETAMDYHGFLVSKGITTEESLKDPNSGQYKALHWITEKDEAKLTKDDPEFLQRYAMAVLYHATQPKDQEEPQFDSWKSNDKWLSKHSICEWYGIDCEHILAEDVVVHVNLANNQLQGTIPNELKALQYMVQLDLSKNQLGGQIPESIGHMTHLNFLLLQENVLSGKIPPSIGSMVMAEMIFLSHNKLEGLLPENLGHIEKLRELKVDHNLLSGNLPNAWKQKHIRTLYLQNNEFKGHIPHQLFQLTTLVDFRIGNNHMTGTLPPEMESIYNLQIFDISMNRLHGSVPEIWDRLHHLKFLNLHHNSFEGTLPKTMSGAASLERLVLDENFITGTIPPSWAGMTNLQELTLKGNKLTGSIPITFGLMKALRGLWLSENQMTGHIPGPLAQLTELEDLHLEKNHFDGAVPTGFGDLKQLKKFKVQETKVTGSMPPGVCDLLKNGELETLEANCAVCDCCTECV